MKSKKYSLKCRECDYLTPNFGAWFEQNQLCPECGSKHSEVWYNSDYEKLPMLIKGSPENFWQYFNFLPLESRDNIITCNEGAVPVQKWDFLEEYAKSKYGIECNVFVYRNDLNGGTGTFKDVAAALAASLFKEFGIKRYTVASTGNTATSYARYLAIAGVNASIFIPDNALEASEAHISAYGQKVFRVKGDYAKAKKIAAEYAKEHNILISSGNIDPIRVEAKKTMVFEWLRQMDKFPDVYIQAISGGTGPIAIDKGIREVKSVYPELKNPRFLMVQPDKCDPMVKAWENATKKGFPEDFEMDYPIIENPGTAVPTLATGNPATYPIIAKLVKDSGGNFLRMKEDKLIDYGKLVAYERQLLLGPASAVCIAGFFEALKAGNIKNGETVLLNTGEGVLRAPDFVSKMTYTSENVTKAADCKPHSIEDYRESIWNAIEA